MSESQEKDKISDEELEQALVDIENVGDQSKAFDILISGYVEREDFDSARRIRDIFRRSYALTEDQWLDWIEDEICSAETEEDKKSIEKLCQYAIKDVYSVSVWKDYCEHCSKLYPDDEKKVIDLYEEAVSTVGTNLAEGKDIWESYINYLLSRYSNNNNNNKSYITQIRNIYLRQFAIPLKGNEESYEEYVKWENDTGNGKTDNTMNKLSESQCEYEKRIPYENAITEILIANEQAKSNKLPTEEWKQYIEYMKSIENNEENVIKLYERCTSDDVRKDEGIWNDYINYYLTYKNFDKNYFLSILKRAFRTLLKPIYFIYYINYNELYNDEYLSFIDNFTSRIMKYKLFYSSEISQILLEVIHSFTSYYKTNQKALDKNNNKEQFTRLLDNILSYMESHHFDKLYDRYPLYKYGAIYYNDIFNDEDKAEECWNNLGQLFISSTYFYIDYINWLKTKIYKNESNENEKNKYIEKCKNVITSIVNNVQLDDYKTFYDFWRDFEYKYGDINSLLKYHLQSQPSYDYWLKQMIEIEKTKEIENEKHVGLGKKKEKDNNKSKFSKERKQKQKPPQPEKRQKRKMSDSGENNKNEEHPNKKQKIEKKEKVENKKEVEKMEIEEKEENNHQKYPKLSQHNVTDDAVEEGTIFIKNLSFKTTEVELAKHFERCGKIAQVRLILNLRGTSRGIAYIDFESPDSVKQALQLNGSKLTDRNIVVQKSLPPGARDNITGPTAKQSHPKTIFIRKLTTDTTEEEIIKEFEQYGKVHKCQLVTDKDKKVSKGYALLEFEEDESVEKTLSSKDIELKGSKLSITRSRYGITDKEEIKKKKEEEIEMKFAQHKRHALQIVPLSVKAKQGKKKEEKKEEKSKSN